MDLSIVANDFDSPRRREAIVDLLAGYATDPETGGGRPMADDARAGVVDGLRRRPTALVLLAEAEDQPVGLAVCFEGFSTFTAKPLLNLHDLVVHPDWRGRGVGGELLAAVEEHARRRGCCVITLEVIGANTAAQRLYRRHGFEGGDAIEPSAAVMFWKKRLDGAGGL